MQSLGIDVLLISTVKSVLAIFQLFALFSFVCIHLFRFVMIVFSIIFQYLQLWSVLKRLISALPYAENVNNYLIMLFYQTKQVELGDKMDLASYLLKPVQRMGKYALLLQQLMKAYPDKEVDVTDIRAAEQMVRFQLRHGNDLLAMDSLRDCDVSNF